MNYFTELATRIMSRFKEYFKNKKVSFFRKDIEKSHSFMWGVNHWSYTTYTFPDYTIRNLNKPLLEYLDEIDKPLSKTC